MKILEKANTKWTGPDPKSFYNLFEYHRMADDMADCTLMYEQVVVTKSVTTESGLELKQGDTYDAVMFQFDTQEFLFIRWAVDNWPNSEVDAERSVFIPQAELVPYLHWNTSVDVIMPRALPKYIGCNAS